MDNKQFRDAMYNKYEYIKRNNNDDFFNTYHYKKNNRNNIINKVAAFFICTIMMGSVVYAGTVAYQYFTQKNAQAKYIEDMNSWFEINQQETYYKKISSYEEYLKYKENWDSIIDMNQEDFENNFLIVIIATWRMPGITISNISADNNTLYVELDRNVTEEEIEKKEYMVSAMVSREVDRENISVKNIVKNINSDKYVKLEKLPVDYNIESAEQDGCIIINNLEMKEKDKERFDNFINNTKNGNNDYIRIFRRGEIIEKDGSNRENNVIIDIEYRDGEFIVYMDETRMTDPSDKTIKYLGTFQDIEKTEIIDKNSSTYGQNRIFLIDLNRAKVCVAIYK